MSGPSFVSNVQGALSSAPVDDFTTFQDANGFDIEFGKGEVYNLRAAGTISRGNALEFVAATTTVPESAQVMATATDIALYAGVALHDAEADDLVHFMRRGFSIVTHETADTPAHGNVLLKPDTTAGHFATAAAGAAGGQSVLGVVLGPEINTSDTCPAFLDPTPATSNNTATT